MNHLPELALQGRSKQDSDLICLGPNLVPDRLDVPQSKGTPNIPTSNPKCKHKKAE